MEASVKNPAGFREKNYRYSITSMGASTASMELKPASMEVMEAPMEGDGSFRGNFRRLPRKQNAGHSTTSMEASTAPMETFGDFPEKNNSHSTTSMEVNPASTEVMEASMEAASEETSGDFRENKTLVTPLLLWKLPPLPWKLSVTSQKKTIVTPPLPWK